MIKINANDHHTITLEKVSGQWWLELVNRASGHSRIIYFNNKAKAQAFCAGMDMPDIVRMYDKLNVKETPMYKAGAI